MRNGQEAKPSGSCPEMLDWTENWKQLSAECWLRTFSSCPELKTFKAKIKISFSSISEHKNVWRLHLLQSLLEIYFHICWNRSIKLFFFVLLRCNSISYPKRTKAPEGAFFSSISSHLTKKFVLAHYRSEFGLFIVSMA